MGELGPALFLFLSRENDLSKVRRILGLTFFKARKDFEGFKMRFSIYCYS